MAAIGEALSASSPEDAPHWAGLLSDLAAGYRFERNASPVRHLWRLIDIVRRSDPATVGALAMREAVRRWDRLPPETRSAILSLGEGRWEPVVDGIATDPNASVRASLARFCCESGAEGFEEVAAELACDQDRSVAAEASQSLLILALGALAADVPGVEGVHAGEALESLRGGGTPNPQRLLMRRMGSVLGAAQAAIARVATLRGEEMPRGLALGAIVAAARGRRGPLHDLLCGGRTDALKPIRAVLRTSKLPIVRLRALELCVHEHLRIASVQRLGTAHSVADHEAVLGSAHLAARPLRRNALRDVRLRTRPPKADASAQRKAGAASLDTTAPLPGPEFIGSMSLSARLGATRLIGTIHADGDAKAAVLDGLLSDPEVLVRHGAARVHRQQHGSDWCFDADAGVARHMSLRLACGSIGALQAGEQAERRARVWRTLSRSPHAAVRSLAAAELNLAPCEHASLGDRVALRRRLAINRESVVESLRRRLEQPELRLGAIGMARSLGLGAELSQELLRLVAATPAGDGLSLRAAAAAVTLLAETPGTVGDAALKHALGAADARIRANAVEGLVRRARMGLTSHVAVLAELKGDEHHRIRANAMRAELVGVIEGDGYRGVEEMLTDGRDMHRLAGLWLAGRCLPAAGTKRPDERLGRLASRVAELARTEPAAPARARARACLDRLRAGIGAAWTAPEVARA